jgi:hypothetical protein
MSGVSADKTTNVTLDGLVDSLSLAVRLGVVSCAHAQLGASGFENSLPELTRKNWVTIRD